MPTRLARHIVATLVQRKRAAKRHLARARAENYPQQIIDAAQGALTEAHNSAELARRALYANKPLQPKDQAAHIASISHQIRETWAHLQTLLAEVALVDLPAPIGLKDPLTFRLTREKGDHSPYLAKVHLENFGGEHQEIYVDVMDLRPKWPACVASICATLDHQGHPQVLITTDGQGEGDHNIAVAPLSPAEDAVEIDVHNSQLQRENP